MGKNYHRRRMKEHRAILRLKREEAVSLAQSRSVDSSAIEHQTTAVAPTVNAGFFVESGVGSGEASAVSVDEKVGKWLQSCSMDVGEQMSEMLDEMVDMGKQLQRKDEKIKKLTGALKEAESRLDNTFKQFTNTQRGLLLSQKARENKGKGNK